MLTMLVDVMIATARKLTSIIYFTAMLPIPSEAIADNFQWADLTAESASTAPQSEPRTQENALNFVTITTIFPTHPATRINSTVKESDRTDLKNAGQF